MATHRVYRLIIQRRFPQHVREGTYIVLQVPVLVSGLHHDSTRVGIATMMGVRWKVRRHVTVRLTRRVSLTITVTLLL